VTFQPVGEKRRLSRAEAAHRCLRSGLGAGRAQGDSARRERRTSHYERGWTAAVGLRGRGQTSSVSTRLRVAVSQGHDQCLVHGSAVRAVGETKGH